MEKLKNLYAKDIEREIQGVIKVDDESYISQELDEYVVTDELLKHFNSFFDAYNAGINGNTEKMGVWISGFFGSGKSHFLKIVSYLLENKTVNGKAAVDYFDDKIEDKTQKIQEGNSVQVLIRDEKISNKNSFVDVELDPLYFEEEEAADFLSCLDKSNITKKKEEYNKKKEAQDLFN